jgi:hypothetical protein
MKPQLRWTSAAVLIFAALIIAGCAPLTARSFVARGANFSEFRTYAWADQQPRPTGDPRLDSNPFFETRLRAAVDHELAARGFEMVSGGNADLLLRYYASVDQDLYVAEGDDRYPDCKDCRTASMFDAGTILLDFVDTRTNALVWRGWVEASMDGVIDNQNWLEERVDQTISRIIATIPRRL